MRLGVGALGRRRYSTDRWFWAFPWNQKYKDANNVVLWDMNNTPLPYPLTHPRQFYYFHHNLEHILNRAGFKGDTTIFRIFGDIHNFPFPTYFRPAGNEPNERSYCYTHIPNNGDEDSSFKAITTYIEEVLFYIRPCINCLLISSDERFLSVLNLLKFINCNILVARHENAPQVLDKVASNVWYLEHILEVRNSDSVLKDAMPFGITDSPVRIMKPPWAKGELRDTETIGWWDMNTVPFPIDANPKQLMETVSNKLQLAGYHGYFTLNAYGDKNKIPRDVWEGLCCNISFFFTDLPLADEEDANFKKIFADMLVSTKFNKPPTNYLVISSDSFFKAALRTLRQASYNTLLARPQASSPEPALDSDAWRIWDWKELVR